MYRQLYQMGGGMDQMMEPQMQEPMMQQPMMQQPMMQPQMSPPLEGIMGAMPQGASMAQGDDQGQTALLTIIQLLIEQGIPPEQAQELAMQILQVFSQGGEPAVEAFANQLEQEEGMQEGMQEPMMMAGGGIIALRQGAKFGKIFKSVGKAVSGVAKAVKSVAKSPIGMIALSIAAPYAISAMYPGFATLGTASLGTFGGAALRAGLSNLAIQGIATGKINPKQALMAAVGGGIAGSVFGPAGNLSTDPGTLSAGGLGIPGADVAVAPTTLSGGVVQSLPTSAFPELAGQVTPGSMVYNPPTTAAGTYPSLGFEVSPTSPVVNVGATQPNTGIMASLKNFGTNLMSDPLKTLGNVGSSVINFAKENPATTILGGTFALNALAQQQGETDEQYNLRAQRDPQVAAYITQYGRGSKLYSPTFYSMEKAVDPFAGLATYAANGGRIGFEEGSKDKIDLGNLNEYELFKLKELGYNVKKEGVGQFGGTKVLKDILRVNKYAMGGEVPTRKNPAGIMELDYRKTGGFVPPIGIKEKADDIPAMLSNNEFVFTADAVRNAGGGNVNKGAERMYSLMKNLEAGGRA